jgi:hypothetical protein
LAVVTAVICADYFLYDPIFVFDIPGREEVSDVACFVLLALLAIKCVHELFRPSEELSAGESRYGRLHIKIGTARTTALPFFAANDAAKKGPNAWRGRGNNA